MLLPTLKSTLLITYKHQTNKKKTYKSKENSSNITTLLTSTRILPNTPFKKIKC